jgi:hypothetical protein
MPFTPFHMGPGLALKAIGGRHLSVLAFGLAQVAMDLEPLLGMIRGSGVLHGPTHTFAGALAIGVGVALLARWPCTAILRTWNALSTRERVAWMAEPTPIPRHALWIGALLGTFTHVLLDGIMHSDLHPFAPWSQLQPWWRLVSIGTLHLSCVVAGVIGVAGWTVVAWRRRSRIGRGPHIGDEA